MFLEMQDFDFAQILSLFPKFGFNFAQICRNLTIFV